MPKSYRIRTQPGVDKSIKIQLDQDFEYLEILSLKILQSDIYTRVCSDYGVIVGRVSVNDGFGIPNAKVSVFIPLSNEDELATQEQQTPASNTDFDPFDNPDPIDYDNLTADTNIDPDIKKSSEKKPVKTPVKAAAVDSEFDDLFNS